ncbi:MAG: hypothetical protein ABIG10_00315 [bacterium]
MEQIIKEVLDDLYRLDPNLIKQEKELVKIIKAIMKSKPKAAMTKNFKDSLKAELLARVTKTAEPETNKFKLNYMSNLISKLSYVAAGALIVAMVIFVPRLINKPGVPRLSPDLASIGLTTKLNIKSVKNNAFGSLTSQGSEMLPMAAEMEEMASSDSSALAGRGGGGPIAIDSEKAMVSYPFIQTFYKFVYKGNEINIDQKEMAVYKRLKTNESGSRLAQALKKVDLGIIDIKSLGKPLVENLSIMEDKEGGYIINLNMRENMLSINRNYYIREPMPLMDKRMTESDIPSDEQLIKISNNFLRKYNINLSAYGDPEVDNNWRVYYESGEDKYIPQMIQIIYPLSVNNQFVYDEAGSKTGPIVTVDISNNEVEGLWGITSNDFEQSQYATEQDNDKLISLAEKGGWRQRYYYNEGEGEEIEISLGQPTIEYIKIYHYTPEEEYKNSELLVPSLVFPVIDIAEGKEFWQQYVIVPLIKDLLESQPEQPVMRPMSDNSEEQVEGAEAMIQDIDE